MTARLAQTDRDLAARLAGASPLRQRAAAGVAAIYALDATDVSDDTVQAVRAQLEQGVHDPAQREVLDRIVAELDGIAMSVRDDMEDGNTDYVAYLKEFSRARAVSALSYAMDEDPERAALESVYEACSAMDDVAPIRSKIEAALLGPS